MTRRGILRLLAAAPIGAPATQVDAQHQAAVGRALVAMTGFQSKVEAIEEAIVNAGGFRLRLAESVVR